MNHISTIIDNFDANDIHDALEHWDNDVINDEFYDLNEAEEREGEFCIEAGLDRLALLDYDGDDVQILLRKYDLFIALEKGMTVGSEEWLSMQGKMASLDCALSRAAHKAASKLTYSELNHLMVSSFCPPIESFDSIEDARSHYSEFVLTEWEFFKHYTND